MPIPTLPPRTPRPRTPRAARGRDHAEAAAARERRTAALCDTSRELGAAVERKELVAAAARHIGPVFDAEVVVLAPEVKEGTYAAEKPYLRVHMGQLRSRLEPDPARPRFLITEPGVGYRLQLEEGIARRPAQGAVSVQGK